MHTQNANIALYDQIMAIYCFIYPWRSDNKYFISIFLYTKYIYSCSEKQVIRIYVYIYKYIHNVSTTLGDVKKLYL